jgi:type VI secretion system protein ImpC
MANPESQPKAAPAATTVTTSAEPNPLLDQLNGAVGARSQEAKDSVRDAVQALCRFVLERSPNVVDRDAMAYVNDCISALEEVLNAQINEILHDPKFQELESTWRGLWYMVSNTETGQSLKIRVLNISKQELAEIFGSEKYQGAAWDQSPIFKKVYNAEFDMPGGKPYGLLVGDYYFDHSPQDLVVLRGMMRVAAAAHAPFVTGAAPTLLGLTEGWQQLNEPRDLSKVFEGKAYTAWRSLREDEDSRYLALTGPRVLGRLPYGKATLPVSEFGFEEEVDGKDPSKFVWMNSAYALAFCIARSFKISGWCSRIWGPYTRDGMGGKIEELPCYTFPTDDGDVDLRCPTEIAIGGRRSHELDELGLIPLCHWKETDHASFMGAQSVQKPKRYADADSQASANLSARLNYLLAACRFAHYLKVIVREKLGSYRSRGDLQADLQEWIKEYVTADPNPDEEAKAKRPLASATVIVEDVPGNPGYYTARFLLRPHFQLEGLKADISLTSRLPSK